MNFDQIPLYAAVYRVRRELDSPGSEAWTSDESRRVELTQLVLAEMVVNADQQILEAFLHFRKSQKVDGVKKLDLKIQVAELHGHHCFYRNRGLGGCSADVHLERIGRLRRKLLPRSSATNRMSVGL